jgi:hypothetical protein
MNKTGIGPARSSDENFALIRFTRTHVPLRQLTVILSEIEKSLGLVSVIIFRV